MTVLLVIAGAVIGLSLSLALATALPARATLANALAAPNRHSLPPRPPASGIAEAAGRPAVNLLITLGLPRTKTRANLRALEREAHLHLAHQAGLAIAGLVLVPVLALGLGIAGLHLPLVLPAVGALLAAAAGFMLPDRLVAAEADKLRVELRYALSAFLDLAATMLAAGSGLEEALAEAAQAGTGPGHTRLRAALAAAQTTRTPVWDALAEIGASTGVAELTELAASASLAGTEGAKIRGTLAAKAAAVRNRLLSAAEAEAASATERMSLPTVLLMTGFLIFTAYPALASVLGGLG
ncbi:MAG: type II secretion system F family protein [Sciscionella sp.]